MRAFFSGVQRPCRSYKAFQAAPFHYYGAALAAKPDSESFQAAQRGRGVFTVQGVLYARAAGGYGRQQQRPYGYGFVRRRGERLHLSFIEAQ